MINSGGGDRGGEEGVWQSQIRNYRNKSLVTASLPTIRARCLVGWVIKQLLLTTTSRFFLAACALSLNQKFCALPQYCTQVCGKQILSLRNYLEKKYLVFTQFISKFLPNLYLLQNQTFLRNFSHIYNAFISLNANSKSTGNDNPTKKICIISFTKLKNC